MDDAALVQQEEIARSVNEGIEEGLWPGEPETPVRIRCECGHVSCNGFVEIRVAEYERVRANPRQFLILPGHDIETIERVVERRSEYEIVEKVGAGGADAEATDPRRPGLTGRAGEDPSGIE